MERAINDSFFYTKGEGVDKFVFSSASSLFAKGGSLVLGIVREIFRHEVPPT